MAKIDRFLSAMIGHGAPILRLDPGDRPVLELPGGHRTPLAGSELLGAVLDGLAKEILPPDLETSYLRGEKVQFEYTLNGEPFQVLFVRSNLGARIVVGRGSSHGAVPVGGAPGALKAAKLDLLVARMLASSASDLYLNTDEFPILRRDGRLEIQDDIQPLGAKELDDLLKPWIPSRNQEVFRSGQDTEFSHVENTHSCRLRISLFHDSTGPSLAFRMMPKQVPDAETLGLSEPIKRLANLDRGLVLLTGPMGSGKTTTLACLLELAHRNRRDFIVGVHDALEFELGKGSCLVRQREVGRSLQGQHQAIRSALRQAPDILAIDEMRDPEACVLAIQAVHAGHVVFAVLQTTTIQDTLECIIDGFSKERQPWIRSRLAGCLKTIVGHTLLRRPAGGRAAAMESLFNTPSIAEHIRHDRLGEVAYAMKEGRYGQVNHDDALIQLIVNNQVEAMEAYMKCQDRESFIKACKQNNIDFDPRKDGKITTEI